MFRSVTPTLGNNQISNRRQEEIGNIPLGYPESRLFYQHLKAADSTHGKVDRTVTNRLTVYSAEKHSMKLYNLGYSDLSITPTREITVDARIVVKYNGYFPTPYRLDPSPCSALAYYSERNERNYLYIVGRRIQIIEIDPTQNYPYIA